MLPESDGLAAEFPFHLRPKLPSSRRLIVSNNHTHIHTQQHHMAAQVCCQQPVYKVLLKHGPTGALTYTLCIYGCWHFACLQTLDGEYLSCKHCIWRQRARATRWILLVEQHNPFWKSNRKRQEPKTFYLSGLFWALWNIYSIYTGVACQGEL